MEDISSLKRNLGPICEMPNFCVLEQGPLMDLSKNSELKVHKHKGYWQCMDTQRDKEELKKNSNVMESFIGYLNNLF